MEAITSFGVLVVITTAVVEVLKRATGLNKKFIPLTSLIVGLILNFIAVGFYFNSITILTGIVIGLSAAGLFDQTKLLKK